MATILSLKGVTKSYRSKTGAVSHVLDGIDLDVEEGEFIAILGFFGRRQDHADFRRCGPDRAG
ncbi:hypothetical protein ACFSTD_06720 [Novosphingobium colocasiae]